jgi:hypothetical protein
MLIPKLSVFVNSFLMDSLLPKTCLGKYPHRRLIKAEHASVEPVQVGVGKQSFDPLAYRFRGIALPPVGFTQPIPCFGVESVDVRIAQGTNSTY